MFLFFGLMAVCGTIYVQAGTIGTSGWLAGVAIGLLAASVLTVNNHRDIAHDASTGRRTMAVLLGARGSRAGLYANGPGAGRRMERPPAVQAVME